MKLNAAALASFLRPAAAAVLLLLFIGWDERAGAHPVDRPLSPVLRHPQTYQDVREVSEHANDGEDDTSMRAMPRVNTDDHHLEICCLHANILDYYLTNILHHTNDDHTHMHRLKTSLHRISTDLQAQGCNVTQYHDHKNAVDFRTKLEKMEKKKGITKAIGELDILFSYLQDYCVEPRKDTAA
uniref:Interleukin 22 n=1 Tax=Amphilophus citrinellus TaxID=61819 RepID=A0A3Q0S6J3_AMPCI